MKKAIKLIRDSKNGNKIKILQFNFLENYVPPAV